MADVHPIEKAQAELYEATPDGATVGQAVACALGLEADNELEQLIVRQLRAADQQVDRYVPQLRSVRRAGVGCGFVAGVTFAAAARRARMKGDGDEHDVDDAELQALLPELAKAIDASTPDRVGFALLLFEWVEGGGLFYVSNAERSTMIKAMQEFVRKQKERGR